ncbi:hypothetical protein BDD12DRAFT_113588 [Trichophaea hybrida]|nr:hypothetical protein BDD12DRAFT_113588 [Trichophaea hybrida]
MAGGGEQANKMKPHPPRPRPRQQENKNPAATLQSSARGHASAQGFALPKRQSGVPAVQSHATKREDAITYSTGLLGYPKIAEIKKQATECSDKIRLGFFRRGKILKQSLDVYLQAMWYHDTAAMKDFLVVEGVFNGFKRKLGIDLREQLFKEHQIAINTISDFGGLIVEEKPYNTYHHQKVEMHVEEKLAQIKKRILSGEFQLVEYIKLAGDALTSHSTARKCLFKGIISSMNILIRQEENGTRILEFPKDLRGKFWKGVAELEDAMRSEYLYQVVLLVGVHGAHSSSLQITKGQFNTPMVTLEYPSVGAHVYWHQHKSLFGLVAGLESDILYESEEPPAQTSSDARETATYTTRRSIAVEVRSSRSNSIDTTPFTPRRIQISRTIHLGVPSPSRIEIHRPDKESKKLQADFRKRWQESMGEKSLQTVFRKIQSQRKCRYCYLLTSVYKLQDRGLCWSSRTHTACLGCTLAGLVCDIIHESSTHDLSVIRLPAQELPEITFRNVWAFITCKIPSIEFEIAEHVHRARMKCLHCILDLQRKESCSRQASLREIETKADLFGMPKNTLVACESCENNKKRGGASTPRCSIIWLSQQSKQYHLVELLWREEVNRPNPMRVTIHKLPLYNRDKTANELRNQQHLVVYEAPLITRHLANHQEKTFNRRVSDPPVRRRRPNRYNSRERRRSASPGRDNIHPERHRLVQSTSLPETNRRTVLNNDTEINRRPRHQRN